VDSYLTPADLIARGLNLPPLSIPLVELPPGTECAITVGLAPSPTEEDVS